MERNASDLQACRDFGESDRHLCNVTKHIANQNQIVATVPLDEATLILGTSKLARPLGSAEECSDGTRSSIHRGTSGAALTSCARVFHKAEARYEPGCDFAGNCMEIARCSVRTSRLAR